MEISRRAARRVIKAQITTVLFSAAAFSQAGYANTLHVCATCAHKTIQSAVNDAASGDTVAVAAGRYVENITARGKSLTIQGAGSPTTSVVAAGRGPVFTLGSGAAGDPNYLSEYPNGADAVGRRDYAEAGLTRRFRPTPTLDLEVSGRAHLVQAKWGYSYRVMAVVHVPLWTRDQLPPPPLPITDDTAGP